VLVEAECAGKQRQFTRRGIAQHPGDGGAAQGQQAETSARRLDDARSDARRALATWAHVYQPAADRIMSGRRTIAELRHDG